MGQTEVQLASPHTQLSRLFKSRTDLKKNEKENERATLRCGRRFAIKRTFGWAVYSHHAFSLNLAILKA